MPNEGINPSALKPIVDYSIKFKDSAEFLSMLAGLIPFDAMGNTVEKDGNGIQDQKASNNPWKILGTAREGLKDVILLAVSRTEWTAVSGQMKLHSRLPNKPYQASNPLILAAPQVPSLSSRINYKP